jgi:hypothetical protein
MIANMSQTIYLADQLVNDAKSVAELFGRSTEAQIAYWAQLGRAVDAVLDNAQVASLLQATARTKQ